MATTRKLHYKAVNDDLATHVGKPGDIFYDPAVAELRMYDGNPGGMVITGGGGNTSLPVYVDPAPVAGNYMSVAVADYGTVIITGNLTGNFTLNLVDDDAFVAVESGETVAGKMDVIFTNAATTYGITGLRANGTWGGGDTIISGTPTANKTTLARVFLTITNNGGSEVRTGYISYTTID